MGTGAQEGRLVLDHDGAVRATRKTMGSVWQMPAGRQARAVDSNTVRRVGVDEERGAGGFQGGQVERVL